MESPHTYGDNAAGAALGPSAPPATSQKSCRVKYVWLLIGVVAIAVAFAFDEQVTGLLNIGDKPAFHQFARIASLAGQGWVVAAFGLVFAPVLVLAGRAAGAKVVAISVLAGLLAGTGDIVIRGLTGRTRPKAHAPQGFYGLKYEGKWIVGKYEFSSFPSGHAATVAGFGWAVWLANRRLGLAAFLYAALVSWSRVAQSAHHFSDVVAGAFLGMVISCLVVHFLGPRVDSLMARRKRKPSTG